MINEYSARMSTRTLTPTPSNGSLQASSSAGALRPIVVREHMPIQPASVSITHPSHYIASLQQSPSGKSLGQSASVSSLLTVASDTSGPPAMAPPSSAALNTGEVLHPYSTMQVQSDAGQYHHGAGTPSRKIASSSSGTSLGSSMAVVHPQSVINNQPSLGYQAIQQPVQAPAQPTWVIEEVIDFGIPLDEAGIREYDDQGYPLGCKLAISPRGRGGLFDGCVRSLCYDEEQVLMMGQQNQSQDGSVKVEQYC